MKNYYLLTFQFFNDLISDNDRQQENINEKLLPFNTSQFSNDEISDNDKHSLNIFEKNY